MSTSCGRDDPSGLLDFAWRQWAQVGVSAGRGVLAFVPRPDPAFTWHSFMPTVHRKARGPQADHPDTSVRVAKIRGGFAGCAAAVVGVPRSWVLVAFSGPRETDGGHDLGSLVRRYRSV